MEVNGGDQKRWKSQVHKRKHYLRPHVEATLFHATIPPAFNEIESHPYLPHGNNYLPWLRENGLQVGLFKGLSPTFRAPDGPLCEPLARITKSHDTTEVAVLISWIIQNKVVAVTTTTKPERLNEYAQAIKITLTQNERQEITDVGSTYHFRTSLSDYF